MTDYADISLRVPARHAAKIRALVADIVSLLEAGEAEEERLYSVTEVFPEGIAPGEVLRGARAREGLTQARLAELVGVKAHHISEMEHGRRAISKDMARRLGKALHMGYKVFL